jgi:hypothetical protein
VLAQISFTAVPLESELWYQTPTMLPLASKATLPEKALDPSTCCVPQLAADAGTAAKSRDRIRLTRLLLFILSPVDLLKGPE